MGSEYEKREKRIAKDIAVGTRHTIEGGMYLDKQPKPLPRRSIDYNKGKIASLGVGVDPLRESSGPSVLDVFLENHWITISNPILFLLASIGCGIGILTANYRSGNLFMGGLFGLVAGLIGIQTVVVLFHLAVRVIIICGVLYGAYLLIQHFGNK